MTHKNRFLFYFTCMAFLSGCGEELSTGVTKGGTGNGGDGKPINVVNGQKLNDHYQIWLSKPVSDYCHGVKRTLSFIHPLNSEIVAEDQLIKIGPKDELDQQIILQVRWENQSDQPKTVVRSACSDLVNIDEFWRNASMPDARCDVKTVTLNKNDVYIAEEYSFNFKYTATGILSHNKKVQFLPEETNIPGCNMLEIQYVLQNE